MKIFATFLGLALFQGAMLGAEPLEKCVKGDCQNGPGTYQWSENEYYTGNFKDGEFDGQGELTTPTEKYAGSFKNGRPHGSGQLFFKKTSESYTGHFKNGLKHGLGTYTWADGSKYQGQWYKGLRHGQGTYTWSEGYSYIGQWHNDLKEGAGHVELKSGKQVQVFFTNDELSDGRSLSMIVGQ